MSFPLSISKSHPLRSTGIWSSPSRVYMNGNWLLHLLLPVPPQVSKRSEPARLEFPLSKEVAMAGDSQGNERGHQQIDQRHIWQHYHWQRTGTHYSFKEAETKFHEFHSTSLLQTYWSYSSIYISSHEVNNKRLMTAKDIKKIFHTHTHSYIYYIHYLSFKMTWFINNIHYDNFGYSFLEERHIQLEFGERILIMVSSSNLNYIV